MDLMLLDPTRQVIYQPLIYQVYIGEKIGIKPSLPLQNTLASLIDLNSMAYLFRQLISGEMHW